MVELGRFERVLTLKEHNESVKLACDILTGREYRRKLRKERRKR